MSILFLCILFIIPCYAGQTQTPRLVINEIMFNPDGDENAREFVELFNLSEEPVSLEGFIIGDGAGFDSIIPAREGSWIVPAGAYALILDPDYFDAGEPYGDIPADTPLFTVNDKAIGSRGLSNSKAEPVCLISDAGDTLSVVTYSLDCPPGHSWERIVPYGGDNPENFAPSDSPDGTPGRTNSVTPPAQNPVLEKGLFRFTPLDSRMGESIDIMVSYRNGGLETVSGVEVVVQLFPDITVGSVFFPEEVSPGRISTEKSLGLDNVPGGRLAFAASTFLSGVAAGDTLIVLLDVSVAPGTLILNEVMAAPESGAPEWIEVKNTGSVAVDLFKWGVLDLKGTAAGIVNEHVFVRGKSYAVLAGKPLTGLLPGDIVFVSVENFPQLNNDGDEIKLLDFTGAVHDSMYYEDALKGFSLERISEDVAAGFPEWDTSTSPEGATPGRKNSITYELGKKKQSPVVKIEPNPFADMVTISYELPFPLARVSLYIYDRRGRLVAKLRDAEESGSKWSCTWDGRSDGSRLPAGPYILNLEALDKRTGRVVTEKKMVVVAARL